MNSSDSEEPPREFDEYRILRLLGEGAMGRVYLAEDTLLEREVAIKLIHQANETRRERFVIEARATARVQHPNIVSIYRIGKIGNQPYIVEEYVRGQILAVLPKPMPWHRALELGIGLARGLAAAHRCGVLHRDIKPENVILSDSGAPKLADFGLAKFMDEAEPSSPSSRHTTNEVRSSQAESIAEPRATLRNPSLTEDGAILGTPYYMAPEVWCGESATMCSDVYSFGVLLYELCAGRVPHYDAPPRDLKSAVVTQDAPSLAIRVTEVDARFAAIVDRCLARDPEDRFASGDAVLDALAELDSMTRATPVPAGSPYRGLSAFEAEHRAVFFGRDVAIREVVERLRTQSIVLIAGESGVGKSSLARAGVLSSITEAGLGDGRTWQVCTLVPGTYPLAGLAGKLSRVMGLDDTALASELESDCVSVCQQLRRQQGTDAGLVLFVDQLEELVTLADPHEARAASEALACLALRAPGVRLLATARGDKLTELAALPGLGALIEPGLYILRPLQADDIREAIVGPARVKGVRFESEALVSALVEAELEAKGGLPLLQFALAQLWEKRDRKRGVIPDRALEELGGVAGALSRHADQVIQALLPENRVAARKILPLLVNAAGTRARRTEEELVGDDESRREVLRALSNGRLIVVREADGQAAYEITHEALISGWDTLRQWLDEEGSARVLKERLAVAAKDWARMDRSRDVLWSGRPLREAAELDSTALAVGEAEFIKASLREESRGRRFRRILLVGTFAALVVVLAVVLQLNRRANYERERAQTFADESRGHAEQANQNLINLFGEQGRIALLADEPMHAFAYLLAARGRGGAASPATRFMLARATQLLDGQLMVLPAHKDPVMWAKFSPDDSLIATAGSDRIAKLWDAHTGQLLHTFQGYDDVVWMLAFSPDGSRLATASWDSSVKVWNTMTGELVWSGNHQGPVRWIGYTQDGSKIATAGLDMAARIWDANSGAVLGELAGHEKELLTAALSPDGKNLVTGSKDQTVRIWDIATGKTLATVAGYLVSGNLGGITQIEVSPDNARIIASAGQVARVFPLSGKPVVTLADHAMSIQRAGFSPDSSQLVTASEDHLARIWDARTGLLVRKLEGHASGITFAAYNPDGRSIVTTGRDETARVWDASTGTLQRKYVGHQDVVWMADFDAAGDRFVTAGFDGTARVWNAHQTRYSLALTEHTSDVRCAVFSPDGMQIATMEDTGAVRVWSRDGHLVASFEAGEFRSRVVWSPDGNHLLTSVGSALLPRSHPAIKEAVVWDVRSGKQLFTITDHQDNVLSAAYDLSGSRIVTASADKLARIWDARTGKPLVTLQGHEGEVKSAIFDAGGRRVVTASADKTVRIWDASSGALLRTITGHSLDVVSARFSPGGERIITASEDQTARIWTVDGDPIATLDGHANAVSDATFSRDGHLVATASEDGTARVWDATSGLLLWSVALEASATVTQGRDWPSSGSVDFSPDGRYLLTAWGRTAAVWDIGYDDRSVEELDAFASCRVNYLVDEQSSRLVRRKIDYQACLGR